MMAFWSKGKYWKWKAKQRKKNEIRSDNATNCFIFQVQLQNSQINETELKKKEKKAKEKKEESRVRYTLRRVYASDKQLEDRQNWTHYSIDIVNPIECIEGSLVGLQFYEEYWYGIMVCLSFS